VLHVHELQVRTQWTHLVDLRQVLCTPHAGQTVKKTPRSLRCVDPLGHILPTDPISALELAEFTQSNPRNWPDPQPSTLNP
jgi:hypothetical protein